MSIHVIEHKIDEKIKLTIEESTSKKFNIYDGNLVEKEWVITELKKTNYYYKFTLSSLILSVLLFLIFLILKSSGIIFSSNNDLSKLILLFSILCVSSIVHHYRFKKEKLNQVIYLLNLKNELEELESNHS
jgi:hypothetical protein